MLVQIHTSNLTAPEKEEFETLLAEKVKRFEKRLSKHYPDEDTVKLDAHMKKHDKHTAFEFELVMHLPRTQRPLTAKEVKHTITEPLDSVVKGLDRQLNEHIDRLIRK